MRILLVAVLLIVGCGGPSSQPASKVWQNSDVKIEITKVRLGHLRLPAELKEELEESDDVFEEPYCVIFSLVLTNKSTSRKIDYRRWESVINPLKDDQGNQYKASPLGEVMLSSSFGIARESKEESIYPGKNLSLTLAIEPPVDAAKEFYLTLPATNIVSSGDIDLKISRSDIVEEDLVIKRSE